MIRDTACVCPLTRPSRARLSPQRHGNNVFLRHTCRFEGGSGEKCTRKVRACVVVGFHGVVRGAWRRNASNGYGAVVGLVSAGHRRVSLAEWTVIEVREVTEDMQLRHEVTRGTALISPASIVHRCMRRTESGPEDFSTSFSNLANNDALLPLIPPLVCVRDSRDFSSVFCSPERFFCLGKSAYRGH